MYLFYLTMKTPNGLFVLGILLYTLILAFLCPILRKKGKNAPVRILCIVPLIGALIHFAVYGTAAFDKFIPLYLESLLPLFFLLPGKTGKTEAAKSAVTSVSVLIACFLFLLNAISHPAVHNFTRCSYTDSFTKMLNALEQEYCLNSWKKIDYDALRNEYYPKVEEAEKNNDEAAYAAIITEVTYHFYDSHVSAFLTGDASFEARQSLAGNDYGLSMIQLDDGSVIAIFVEPSADDDDVTITDEGSELHALGIHDGTQILAWDGQEIHEALKTVRCIYPTLHFPVESNEDRFRPIFLAGKGGDSVQITFLNDEENEQTVDVPKIGDYNIRLEWVCGVYLNNMQEQHHHDARMLNEKCGYLQVIKETFDDIADNAAAVRHGYYPKLTEYYAELIEGLKKQGMEYLVIDIRNNSGGADACAGALASLFTDEKRYLVGFGYEDAEGYHTKENLYLFPDGRYKDLPVAVLVNSDCMSAGDGLAKYLGDCENVTLMGLTASSGVNQNNGGRIYVTDHIYVNYPVFLSLSEENVPLIDTDDSRENRIPLDVTIPMTKKNALTMFDYKNVLLHTYGQIDKLEDVELDFAMEYLKQHSETGDILKP